MPDNRIRDLNYLAILAGLCSLSAASLGRDVFAVLFLHCHEADAVVFEDERLSYGELDARLGRQRSGV